MDLCSAQLKPRRPVTVKRFLHPPLYFPTASSKFPQCHGCLGGSGSSSAVRSCGLCNEQELASFSGNAEEGGGEAGMLRRKRGRG